MKSKNILPFKFTGFAPYYDKLVAEIPLADGVKNGSLTTATTKIVITVTDDFLAEHLTRFVIQYSDSNKVFGSGNVDINKTVEIKISTPLTINSSFLIYAMPENNAAVPTLFTPIITE